MSVRMGHAAVRALSCIAATMVLTACASTPATTAPQQNLGATSITTWKDGKRAVYMLAFDDNLPSQLDNAVPMLEERDLVGTFYVVPGSALWLQYSPQWAEAARSTSVVLANHTFTHRGVTDIQQLDFELTSANDALYALYPDRPRPFLMGWARPGGVPWDVTPEEQNAELLEHDLVERPDYAGSPVNFTTEAELLASVDTAIANRGIGHNDMHGIGGDYLVTPLEWFTALLDKIKARSADLWVPDLVSFVKYRAERETARVDLLKRRSGEIRLSLKSDAPSSSYDYPLTLRTEVPQNWSVAVVKQGRVQTAVPVEDGVAQYDAVPGREDISLTAI
ncbi:polysaccharide deacetylase family protein [Mycolicibacterium grossiae]|uniref:polysaccharide deacetylase family protein n=1 Tax=Mycolicibacterium grossiae TaxID=1552759 RepID=UPI00147976C1|nr:polysaccharide deacetylase family protein [Mycolicibacterium grossiae]